ncbi:aminopeptidase P family protein [Donghicola eburneus]|uniref:Xaa-Pro aminopeptidase n=1 Tax=Donghicola eburneus TaxID=393278 RepID=A0A1M4N108_9RHOB|nr:aminopeptidase P family protein [Donghicola eburneus]SCM68550.1 Xaa-Pro aminopeptidase [Donghicola eburneus]SFQ27020.1 Xaa-Pro aminopeptidase [Donghicola eburneus]
MSFQDFAVTARPEQGPPRLAALREQMAAERLAGFLVPRADAHQGEYVAPCDDRLAWLTGFTGSAGFALVLADKAGVFIDGRYRVQVKSQVADCFTPVPWPETKAGDWLLENLDSGLVGYDPWLHTPREIETIEAALAGTEIGLKPVDNLVDRIWADRPARPTAPAEAFPVEIAGLTSGEKREMVAEALRKAGHAACVLTLPDSICWMLNIRGADIAHNPVVQCFAIVFDDACVALFAGPAKFEALGPDPDISIAPLDAFEGALGQLSGPVRLDKTSVPVLVQQVLESFEISIAWGDDPCVLPKACKTDAEIAATRAAHLRDGAAMVEFLCWLDQQTPGTFTEIDVVKALEGFRAATNQLREISFETISGSGPNGAIVHYRVSEESNRTAQDGDLLLVDSGAQYTDGTTDITRTMPIGTPTAEHKDRFTRVLKGMIAISMARFPKGIAGRDLDVLARNALWQVGLDYDHGTGHGVGVYLSVHEGPQRISRASTLPLEPGMILSNEPGYYKEGAYGIRIENLIVVSPVDTPEGGDDHRTMYGFETLTWTPIDRRLIETALLTPQERAWLDTYHATCWENLSSRLSPEAKTWLESMTAPL